MFLSLAHTSHGLPLFNQLIFYLIKGELYTKGFELQPTVLFIA